MKNLQIPFFILLLLAFGTFTITSCSDDEVIGCTDKEASNYDPDATVSGDCEYIGCMDPDASNYDPNATIAGDCEYIGCMDPNAANYNPNATTEGPCEYDPTIFIGNYEGTSECMGGVVVSSLTNNMLNYEIQSALTGDDRDLSFSFPIQGFPVSFDARVNDANELIVDEVLPGLPFQNPANPSMTILVDLKATGTQIYNYDNDSTSGDITITITDSASGATLDQGTCQITGIKQ